jgi:outer membrane protein OmpA-like peptidoglycan-associated protein
MASIVDTITQSMSSGVISQLSTTTGEAPSNIETGLSAAIRVTTASMAMRANDPGAMEQIHAVAIDPASDLSLPDRAEGLVSRVTTGSSGTSPSDLIQSLLLGNRMSNVSDSLASYAGVSTATARSLFGIATSLVLSSLGRMIRADHLDPAALSDRLASERESIVAGLPPALSTLDPSVEATATDVSATIPSAALLPVDYADAPEAEKRRATLTWALPAALVALGAWTLVGYFALMRPPEYAEDASVPPAVGTSGFVKHELPNDVNLRFPPTGTEARLLTFIQGSEPATNENWFEFDRLHFETGSAVLTSDSTEQLSNIAAILQAYPAASVKIGGYTDNAGNPAANMRLSEMRAEAVRDQLQGMGIDASRLAAEGQGDQRPIADNSTAEGRAENRRVAIRVTSK